VVLTEIYKRQAYTHYKKQKKNLKII